MNATMMSQLLLMVRLFVFVLGASTGAALAVWHFTQAEYWYSLLFFGLFVVTLASVDDWCGRWRTWTD